ncbi:MAG: HAMP domain-containing sensor histidine kinase [Desulfobacteraceae bacterium]
MEKNRIKFEFLVHDLKVPLAVIEAGILSLLQKPDKYGPITDKQAKVLERTLRNTIITRTLVNDALELGRSSEGIVQKTRFPPAHFVRRTLVEIFDLNDHRTAEKIRDCETLSDLKKVLSEKKIHLEIDEPLWNRELFLDERKTRQIFRNLLNNALKYRKKQVDLRIEQSHKFLHIRVADDGEGIPSTYHEKIFECYFQIDMQTDHCVRGHGLGLAGVMVLLEDMGGELILESDAGRGATFIVKIPL